ncbi:MULTISPECIES: hypothetical protein [Aphanizomenonaceae]|nr:MULTISPECIES: hypothetical protein [Aphanizomenonaceae]
MIRWLIRAIAVGICLNQNFQDFRISRMRYSVVNSSDRCPYIPRSGA